MTPKRNTRRQKHGVARQSVPALPALAPRQGMAQSGVVLAVGAILQASARYAVAAPPPLPTPCAPCSVNANSLPFVQSGQAGASISGKSLQVTQASNAAILNWQDFNIANGYSVNFKQPSSNAATLNRIWSGSPSTIAGQLSANGQVYLVNQSGIVFANGAQVNVGGLVASTLNIADGTFLNGILSGNTPAVKNSQDLNPVFQDTSGQAQGVTVEQGASLTTADGGRVMLLGTTVTNKGTISTPDGQTVLGAGNTVYLASTTDPAMRGLLIAVDGQKNPANSTVTNQGQISAPRGNITLAGMIVNQQGTVSATTSVNANGSIYLIAGNAESVASDGTNDPFYNDAVAGLASGQMLPNEGGTLTLAAGSVTQIRPDPTDKGTITNQQAFNESQLGLIGQSVTLQGNASIVAPAATVSVVASQNPFQFVKAVSAPNQSRFPTDDSGRIYLDSGSTIDVSGLTDVPIPASRNLLPIQLDANALQDDPLLRNSFLHGATVTIDVNRGSPLLNQQTLNGYANTIARGIDEKLTQAGTINLMSAGDVITRVGSIQNVSGGSIAYQQSIGSTTKLLGADGKTYDISTAPNNIQYVGLADSYSYTDTRWGVTTSWSQKGGLIPSYVQGMGAGTIEVESLQMYLRGSMEANTTSGLFQRVAPPVGGTLILGDPGAVPSLTPPSLTNYAAPGMQLVGSTADDLGAFTPSVSVLPEPDKGVTTISLPTLGAAGFSNFGFYSNGTITLPAGSNVSLPGSGVITLRASSVELDGALHAPGSAVNISTAANLFQVPPAGSPPPDNTTTSPPPNNITLGPGAIIDVSGTWVNDSPLVTTQLDTAPTLYNGGSVTLKTAADALAFNGAHNDIVLGAGSVIDVSGGGWVDAQNKLTAGRAGQIALTAGSVSEQIATGGVELGGSLRGASLTDGGTLSITSAWAGIGADVNGQQGELSLAPNFFTQGGFAAYNITGINGLTIGSGNPAVASTITPLQQNLVFTGNMLRQPTGTGLSSFTSLQTLPDYQRAPANVTFASTASPATLGANGFGNLILNSGASIITDPQADVTLTARGNLTVAGTIDAPAGNIVLQTAPGNVAASTVAGVDDDGYQASQQLLLTNTARLIASGYAAVYRDSNPLGYRLGQVLPGGTIALAASKGSVVAQTGSIMDVSGASAVVDVINKSGVTPTTVAGAAGSIDIEARENIVLNSTLKGGAASVPGASGGGLTIGLDLYDLTGAANYDDPINGFAHPYPTVDRNLTLTGSTQLSDSMPVDQNGVVRDGVGAVSTATIAAGNFDNVTLRSSDVITLDGAVTLTAKSSVTLDAPKLTANPGTRAAIGAPYVALGDSRYDLPGNGESARSDEAGWSPVAGNALLVASADLLDFRGHSVLDGFQAATFNSQGDIRFTYATDTTSRTDFAGSLESAANLTFIAGQLYPTTQTQFTINPMHLPAGSAAPVDPAQASSYDYLPGSITIRSNSTNPPPGPLSALGSLIIDAPSIDQAGVVRAPFGQLAFNGIGAQSAVALHPGSLTSVSADGQTIPYGSTQNAIQWTYLQTYSPTPASQSVALINTLPGKQVALNGKDVSIDPNAKVDVSGGGDLYAYEFVAGTGGSTDVLSPTGGLYSYAILPTLGSQYAPIDYQYGIGSNIAVGKEIYLQGVPGLATGYYGLLPARYALLPGAYAVRLVSPSSDIVPGSAVRQPDGSYLAAGRFAIAGSDVIDSRTSTFDIAPGAVVRTQSEYEDSYANAFFNSAAVSAKTLPVNLPADAGQLQLASSGTMELNGVFGFSPGQFVSGKDAKGNNIVQTGAGGIASLEAPQIEVVEPGAVPDGALQISASSLNQLGAATLILGGSVATTTAGENLSVVASSVKLANSAADPLQGPEIILAATQQVELTAGSSIKASGPASQSATPSSGPATLNVQGDGALLRVSTGQQETVVRTNVPQSPQALLSIGAATNLSASSLALDAAGNTQVDSTAVITAQAVEASSGRVSIGAVPAGTAGLNVTDQLLGNLAGLTDLELHSDSSIDFYGAVTLGALDPTGKPVLANVTLDAGGIAGYGSGDKTVRAGSITLSNVGGVQSPPIFNTAPNGSGALILTALDTGKKGSGQLNLAAGAKDIEGFSRVTLAADGDIRGADGIGSLTFTNAGALTLQSARISLDAGAEQEIVNASGSVSIAATTRVGTAPDAGLGGKLTISAISAPAGQPAIVDNGIIDAPAGIVSLQAHGGDLILGSGAQIVATGASLPFADTYATAAGGTVQLGSDQGNVTLASGSLLDMSGVTAPNGASSDAGTLVVSVPNGLFNQGGTIKASTAAGQNLGNFTLDTLGSGSTFDVSSLNLSAEGFEGAVSIRDRSDGTVRVSGTVRASSFDLSADQGGILVQGTIDTSGTNASPQGGAISLWAKGFLTLDSSALLTSAAAKPASGATARAGDITLGSTSGTIALPVGSTIDIKGEAGTDNTGTSPDGRVLLRAAYDPANSAVNVAPIGATLVSAQPPTVTVEGVMSYTASSIGTTGVDLTYSQLASDIGAFSANVPTITSALTSASAVGPNGPAFTVQVRPGVDISSSGNLTVKSTLDLSSLATSSDSVPIDLTLRAHGDLLINGSISDGFVKPTPTSTAAVSSWKLAQVTTDPSGNTHIPESGNYLLAAGADLNAANPLATTQGTGSLILAPGNLVRTGTGNIGIAAGHDLCLGCNPDGSVSTLTSAQASVIYTAGFQSTNAPTYFSGPTITGTTDTPAAYPTGGGNIDIRVGDDILSAPSTDLASSWLWRQGNTAPNQQKNTSWWVEFSRFQQGVGALGEGDVNVQAGGNITDLSVVVPTNGRVGNASAADKTLVAGNLVVDGGGNLVVHAEGNLNSGLFEADLGTGTIAAGGAIQADPLWGVAPVLVLANSNFDVTARAGVALADIYNSTAMNQLKANSNINRPIGTSYFYTYGAASGVGITSTGGDVRLVNDDQDVLGKANSNLVFDTNAGSPLYPPTLNVAALSGNITVQQTQLFPSATGNLSLLAEGSVALPGGVQMLELDPALFHTDLNPVSAINFGLNTVPLPTTLLHQSDGEPARVVAAGGNIQAGSGSTITIPKQAEFVAGGDIQDVNYVGKNLSSDEVTLFEAGGNIVYTTALNPSNQLGTNLTAIQVGGPGYLEVLAGGGINLANSLGVLSTGNLNDVRLPSGGATLVVAAGLGRAADGTLRSPAYDPFISQYLLPDAAGDPAPYASQLLSYMQQLNPDQANLSQSQAQAEFLALPRKLQLPLVSQVLSAQLSATGLAHSLLGTNYDQGYQAIATLFPSKDASGNPLTYQGDINMFYSQIKTEQGGNINLLAPGGSVVVGVPNPDPTLSGSKQDGAFTPPLAAEANLGILVLGSGGVYGFADQNFEVNQSRILTLQGGDIILWSSNANIDAGKGARTAQGAPPPVVQTDANGNVFVNPVGAVSGSGIGQLLTIPGIKAGLVNLIAPRGAVNAGEAGIRAINLNIAALQVLNVGNIKVSGTESGVPVSDAGAFAGALSGANSLGDSGKSVANQLSQNLANDNFQQMTQELTPTFIVVKMFCLGVQCQTQ
jgi:filamentous hemagglutinin